MSAVYRSSPRCSCLCDVRSELISPGDWRWDSVLHCKTTDHRNWEREDSGIKMEKMLWEVGRE